MRVDLLKAVKPNNRKDLLYCSDGYFRKLDGRTPGMQNNLLRPIKADPAGYRTIFGVKRVMCGYGDSYMRHLKLVHGYFFSYVGWETGDVVDISQHNTLREAESAVQQEIFRIKSLQCVK